MAKKGSLRKISFEEARNEDREYFLSLSSADRWKELETLRRLNYSKEVLQPMKRIITVISRNNKPVQ
jgi:hypothetical protein